jgi:hypothetical protein
VLTRGRVLVLVGLVGLALGAWLALRLRVDYYLDRIDTDPALAQIALRRVGVPAILPLAEELAPVFDTHPMTRAHFRRARILEQLVRDHPEEALALAREPDISPEVARLLTTLCCSHLDTEQLWMLLAAWAERESPWAEQVISWLVTRQGPELRAEALRRARSDNPAMARAGALTLALECDTTGAHQVLRRLCKTVTRETWYVRAVQQLLEQPELEDVPLIRTSLLGDNGILQRQALRALSTLDCPERYGLLFEGLDHLEGPIRRECFATLENLLPGAPEHYVPEVREGLERLLTDRDARLRAGALWLLYPDGEPGPEESRRVTAGVPAAELADSQLYYFLDEEQLCAAARELATDASLDGEGRYREVLLSCFPPLSASHLLELLAVAAGDNRITTIRAFTRLKLQEVASAAGQLVSRAHEDPVILEATGLDLLSQGRVYRALDAADRARLGEAVFRAVDPDDPGNLKAFVDEQLRQAASRLALRLGEPWGERILGALIGLTDGHERAAYQDGLEQLRDR